jgi:nucleotide-binding universal stress UspA family protein
MEHTAGLQGELLSPFTRILVPVDGSDASIGAAELAVRMAAVHHLPVIVMYVIDDRTVEEMVAMSGNAEDTVRRQLEAKGYTYLEHIARIAREYGVNCERVLRRGVPHTQIAEIVRKNGIDLIVIGQTRRQSSRRAFFGSLTEHVMEYVPCSVLVAKME